MRRTRDVAVGVAATLIGVFVALVAAAAGLDTETLSDERLLVSLAVTVPSLVVLWWRRKYPVGVALVLLAPGAVTDMVGGVTAIAVFTVTVHRRLRTALWVAGLHLLVQVPLSVRYPDPDLGTIWASTFGFTVLAIVVAWGSAVRARRELVATLRERAARAEAEAGQRAAVLRGLERERIAREMHDVLAHRISLISLHAGALEIRDDLSREQVAAAGGTIRASAHQAMEELREILGVLRAGESENLRPRQGLEDLDELVAQAREAGMAVRLENGLGDPRALPAAVNRTAFRLVQEGLTNARKHAPGAEVAVRLEQRDELHVRVSNPLPAGPVAPGLPGARSGLVGLGERVALAGGRIEHGVRRGADGPAFTLEAWLPWLR
ncbi:sensor histidine kinase [Dactylosporangium sp. CA-233914]|uniref:sensor histidine kinase n=1 Tax=Dactylosporangium sp. CA-233914 TaxID=3239934 RepID=UPI003D927F69